MVKTVELKELVAMARNAADKAVQAQEQQAGEDVESRTIVEIMERFLRAKGRVVYGGAAINAHLSPSRKFYDPNLYLPDYDFMTPDPLQDCADLIVEFHKEGFTEVEAKFGIHEGTYKIYVEFRSAADITFLPLDLYERIVEDSATIEGIHYASVNFLRMNMYLELSRPAGMVSRWEKIYERLLLLNEEHPLRPGHCTSNPIASLGSTSSEQKKKKSSTGRIADSVLHDRVVEIGMEYNVIFLSGASSLVHVAPHPAETILMMSENTKQVLSSLKGTGLVATSFPPRGEILPARTELRQKGKEDGRIVVVVFETVACHSYTLEPWAEHAQKKYRLGSLDLLIQMYYAMYFTALQEYLPVRLLCVIQEMIEINAERRTDAVRKGKNARNVFAFDCIGHQPTIPELKKAHRNRIREKRNELRKAIHIRAFRRTRKKRANEP
jgi:hypothetical protein